MIVAVVLSVSQSVEAFAIHTNCGKVFSRPAHDIYILIRFGSIVKEFNMVCFGGISFFDRNKTIITVFQAAHMFTRQIFIQLSRNAAFLQNSFIVIAAYEILSAGEGTKAPASLVEGGGSVKAEPEGAF